jgi:serine/threonine protein phosphatase PrpC
MRKSNQDQQLILKDFAGIENLWMMGVMDGHGVNGHLVSNYVKSSLPKILINLLAGQTPEQAILSQKKSNLQNQ